MTSRSVAHSLHCFSRCGTFTALFYQMYYMYFHWLSVWSSEDDGVKFHITVHLMKHLIHLIFINKCILTTPCRSLWYILPWIYLMIGHVWWKQWLAAYFCPIFSRWYPIPMLSPSGHSRLNWLLSSYRFHNPQGVQSVSQSLRAHVFINLYEVFGYLHWNREIAYGRGALYWSDCVIRK